ncbi:FlgD immunoglobulin-like domain containing protein [Streptomyces sp. NPDC004267]|uniref:FlgD immunoglobulin-like domain containing protein n=1 Tax=Streptomyces sp. NPDC004267 TaxID=3364694 RepID=UPI0036B8B151
MAVAAALAPMTPLAAGTAVAAEAPGEVVIPAELSADPNAGRLPAVGDTGFLQGASTSAYNWVSFADGSRSQPFGRFAGSRPWATGSDVMADYTMSDVTFRDPKAGTPQVVPIPANHRFLAVMGLGVVTQESAAPYGMHLRYLDSQGAVVAKPLVGLPAGATPSFHIGSWVNEHGFLLGYTAGGVQHLGWVDSSFTLRPIPDQALRNLPTSEVLADRFVLHTVGAKLQIWDVTGDWSAPVKQIPWAGTGVTPVALLGDYVLARTPAGDGTDTLIAKSLTDPDAPEETVLDRVFGNSPVSPGGSRVVVARQGAGTERTLHSVRIPEGGGAPVASRISNVPDVRTRVAQMSAAQGVLYSADVVSGTHARLRTVDLSVGGVLSAGPRVDHDGSADILTGTCSVAGDCKAPVPTGDGRAVLMESGWGGGLYVLEPGRKLAEATKVAGIDGVNGVAASGRYAVYVTTAGTGVLDLDTQQTVLRRQAALGAAIDGGTLWEGAAGGVLNAVDVRSGTVTRSVKVSDCELANWSVVGDDVLSACGDTFSVRNLTTGRKTAVPGRFARLGDGYVISEQGADTLLTPLRGTAGSRVVDHPGANAPVWSIDRFGGALSYADDQDAIHVVPSGVPAADLAVLDADTPQTLDAADTASWTGRWWLDKPAASWKLALKDRSGAVVRTFGGGEARGLVKAVWDGKDGAGAALGDGRYGWELTAAPADGAGPELRRTGEVFLTHGGLGTYEPVAPARLLNTIAGVGAPKAKVGPGETVTVQITGRGGVPATGVTAVTLNLTATNPSATTYVSAYPYGTARPATSNLNVTAGRSVPNLVTVPVRDGKVTLYNHSGSVDLLADVAGYYTLSGEGDRFAPVAPARVLNTLGGVGAPKAQVAGGKTVTVQIAGRGGVPATGVTAVTMNVTATNTSATTYVSAYPYGTVRPATSNLNLVAGQTAANLVTVPVRDGKVVLYNHSGAVDLLADVAGYFTDAAGKGDRFKALPPARLLNTLGGVGAPKAQVGPGKTVDLQVTGQGGVPAGVSAVVMNVTATRPTATTYVSVYPFGTARPATSNLNVVAGQTVANLVVVPVRDGKVTLYNHSGAADLLADVAGYYTK